MKTWIGLFFLLFAGCQAEIPEPKGDLKTLAEHYLAQHQYQEAVWGFQRRGEKAKADSILTVLEGVLRSEPDSMRLWKGKGITKPYLVYFPHGVRGLFKVSGSDPEGPVKSEVAAYRVDRLLGIGLTSLAVLRDLTLPTGEKVSGSLIYFVPNAKTAAEVGLASTDTSDRMIFFDAVIGNADRHTANWMVMNDTGDFFAIDHNRSFYHELGWTWWERIKLIQDHAALADVYDRFEAVTDKDWKATPGDLVTPEQFKACRNARKTMVRYLKGQVKS